MLVGLWFCLVCVGTLFGVYSVAAIVCVVVNY